MIGEDSLDEHDGLAGYDEVPGFDEAGQGPGALSRLVARDNPWQAKPKITSQTGPGLGLTWMNSLSPEWTVD